MNEASTLPMRSRFAGFFERRSVPIGLSIVIVLASVADNTLIHYLDTDMSWLLIVADKMIAGKKLYVDVWETNPPFSVFLYYPSAWLARLTGLRAEMLVGLSAYLWAAVCLALSAMIARRIGIFRGPGSTWLLPATLALIFLSIPQAFAQREFFGVLASLPMFMVAVARHERGDLPSGLEVRLAICAGLLASVIMLVKPHYALAFLFPYAYLAARHRSLKLLVAPEIIAASTGVIAYGFLAHHYFPEYARDVVPIVLEVYVSRRLDLVTSLSLTYATVGYGILAVYLFFAIRSRDAGPHLVLALGFGGFLLAFISMGKGFQYHALPFVVAGGLASALAISRYFQSAHPRLRGETAAAVAMILLGIILIARLAEDTFSRNDTAQAARDVVGSRTSHPTVSVISAHITTGHPFSRLIGGEWLGRDCSDWVGGYAMERLALRLSDSPDEIARLQRHVVDAVARKREEIVEGAPEILIVSRREARWVDRVMQDPDIRTVVETHYQLLWTDGLTEYLQRK